jgi:hypothetical protein
MKKLFALNKIFSAKIKELTDQRVSSYKAPQRGKYERPAGMQRTLYPS